MTEYRLHDVTVRDGKPILRIIVGKQSRLVTIPLTEDEVWTLLRSAVAATEKLHRR